jgi:hypothetical protein
MKRREVLLPLVLENLDFPSHKNFNIRAPGADLLAKNEVRPSPPRECSSL